MTAAIAITVLAVGVALMEHKRAVMRGNRKEALEGEMKSVPFIVVLGLLLGCVYTMAMFVRQMAIWIAGLR